jgi:hypothetical protein
MYMTLYTDNIIIGAKQLNVPVCSHQRPARPPAAFGAAPADALKFAEAWAYHVMLDV